MPFETADSAFLSGILEKIAGDVALAFSYQAEDVVALHLARAQTVRPVQVFTLDTGRLFPETNAYHAELEAFFGIDIQRYIPDEPDVRALEKRLGEWGMRHSLENRHDCCRVRKVDPLRRALQGKSAWITGLRAAQSVTRTNLQKLEFDDNNGLIKINPLADWSDERLFDYISRCHLPLHPLYAKNFKSIGCAPCTRAVEPHEDIRAGRWWWENPEHKECGLHLKEV
ncbi:phosphoadenosine phosphosulfate reductase [Betaproteobacteria bacterium]|nr:phosphoadenosine phosphosulfate reductase [Betaproteobacteria bacterium]